MDPICALLVKGTSIRKLDYEKMNEELSRSMIDFFL